MKDKFKVGDIITFMYGSAIGKIISIQGERIIVKILNSTELDVMIGMEIDFTQKEIESAGRINNQNGI